MNKKVIFFGWGCNNESDSYMYQIWTYTLRKIFPSLINFDTKENYFKYGKKVMNKKLLDLIKKESPDLILFAFFNDEIYLDTLFKLKKVNAKTIIISCDEDLKYENFYKFMSLFFDYKIASQEIVKENYKRDKHVNIFFHKDYNTFKLKPLNIEKKYDISFIGRPKADRAKMLEYLKEKGINIAIFGWDWYSYEKLKDAYHGPLNPEDYNKVLNQTKINICFTKSGYEEEKNLYNRKGKAFEVPQTKAFQLIEYFPLINSFFKEKKETDTFKTKEELLEKVKYYLKNEKEREEIAVNSFNKINKSYNREKDLIEIFTKIINDKKLRENFPKINKKIITLSINDLFDKKLKEKVIDYDYITFSIGNDKISKYRSYIQAYSLEKSDKEISCSDYYVYSNSLGDIALFRGDWAFRRIGKEANKLIHLNQLMVRKDFFTNNIKSFRDLVSNNSFNLIDKENTIFVSLPLMKTKTLKVIEFEKMKKALEIRFTDNMLSLLYRRKLFYSLYPYAIIGESISGNKFLFQYLIDVSFDKKTWDKLMLNQKYLGGFLTKIIKKF